MSVKRISGRDKFKVDVVHPFTPSNGRPDAFLFGTDLDPGGAIRLRKKAPSHEHRLVDGTGSLCPATQIPNNGQICRLAGVIIER